MRFTVLTGSESRTLHAEPRDDRVLAPVGAPVLGWEREPHPSRARRERGRGVNEALLHGAQVLVWASVPVLVAQGRRVRRDTPRLAEAEGPDGAAPGDGRLRPLRLLVLGESTAAGVGVSRHEEGIAGRLAAALALRTGRGVRWRVVARSGATAREVERAQLHSAEAGPAPDVVVVLAAVNDVLRLTSLRGYEGTVARIASGVRARWPGVSVVLGGAAALHRFPALPSPMRQILGLRARAVDRALARAATRVVGARHVAVPRTPDMEQAFASDGFHPGAPGYRAWAEDLAHHCVPESASAPHR